MRYFEVFWIFLKLGCTSFGGPIAHIAYFRQAFVNERSWLSDTEYASILALCQALPGPASSQVGFTIGLTRAGLFGAILAFVAFTLPSVILLLAFANALFVFESEIGQAVLEGLMIVAFSVVFHGVIGMGKSLCAGNSRFFIALATFIAVLIFDGVTSQIIAIFVGGALGYLMLRRASNGEVINTDHVNTHHLKSQTPKYTGALLLLSIFFALFVILPFVSPMANEFYRSGALVFGGGHVVLPLLESALVDAGAVSQEHFLAGYGATQAVPGPLFSFAAYLGFIQSSSGGVMGAFNAIIFIFLPGFLLVYALYPLWQSVSQSQVMLASIAGANAAVVGLLAAALYDPIFIHAIDGVQALAIAAGAYGALARLNIPVIWVVFGCVALKCAALLI